MELSQLDGFLAALVVGPEFIAPGRWVPVVWGGEDAAFENSKQAGQVVNAIMRRYREIIRLVQKHPESYAPIFRKGADGKVSAEGWASGFVTGVRLNRDAWEPLTEANEESVLLGPIFAQLDDKNATLASNFEPSRLGAGRELAADFIAQAVLDIERFWRARRTMVVPHQTIGRNTPCPCGSGNKYKRCCGSA
jgi:uncharacterized protein